MLTLGNVIGVLRIRRSGGVSVLRDRVTAGGLRRVNRLSGLVILALGILALLL